MTPLPRGWSKKKLGEIADTQLGKMLNKSKQNDSRKVPYLRTDNVHWGRIDLSLVKEMEITPDERDKFIAKPGDLLVCEGGASGRTAIWNLDYEIGIQNHLHRVRTRGEVSNKYLMYYMEWLVKNGLINHLIKGVTISHLSQSSLRSIGICYPEINEQNQIVELLEDHLSRLDAALADVKQAKTKAAQFRASVLNSIFFDYGSKGWPLYKAADLGKWITGSTPSSKVSDYVGTDVPFITPGDIIDGGEIADYSRMISNSGADSVRRLRSNAVHLVCIGATLGKVGIARFESTSNQQINALEANEEIVLPDFAMWLLASPAMQRELWDASSSTTVPILNKGNLEKIEVRVPAISEQIKVLEEFDRASLTLEHLAKDFEIMLEKSNGLRRSILQAAFTGQLTKEVVSV